MKVENYIRHKAYPEDILVDKSKYQKSESMQKCFFVNGGGGGHKGFLFCNTPAKEMQNLRSAAHKFIIMRLRSHLHRLNLFRMVTAKKALPTSFSPVISTNIGLRSQNLLNFS